jgi:hypothetical protein
VCIPVYTTIHYPVARPRADRSGRARQSRQQRVPVLVR